ncbi:MAG: ABC transporter ATP-binding protein [bacterium]|nr:ABC transporter ATP-binding protein [bacterium]MDT8367056.1 ABC transporter ATP-binding protein [bacterium]
MINLNNISVTYQTDAGDHNALNNVDFSLETGLSCVFIGPTGCGKSSLLYLLAGLLKPTSGQVIVNGEPLVSVRLSTSLILQQHGLFPWKNTFENTSLGLTLRGAEKEGRSATIKALMEDMGIWDVRDSFPGQLSGGQRQRVAIARSLATEPDLLLMDEPFSALDSMTRESLQNLVLGLWRKRSFTFVLVTHSIEEAVFLGRRIVILSPRPGRIISILDNPGMGEGSYRLSEEYHLKCREIRQIVEGIS